MDTNCVPTPCSIVSADGMQHRTLLSNDPLYLLGLMDCIDTDDSDDDFDGYLDTSTETTMETNETTMETNETTMETNETTMETNETTTETTAETEHIDTTGTRLQAPSIQAPPVAVIPAPTMTFPVAVIPPATAVSTAAVTPPAAVSPPATAISTAAVIPPAAVTSTSTAAATPPAAVNPPTTAISPAAVIPPAAVTPSAAVIPPVAVIPPAPPVAPPATVIPPVPASLRQGQPSTAKQLPQFSEATGVVPDMTGKEPGEFFDLFFSGDVINNIHTETNRYAEQYLEKKSVHLQQHPYARANAYRGKPITVSELKVFFAMLIMMGAISLPSLPLYWTSKWPFSLPAFSSLMPRNRFELILKFLHFNNNDNQIPRHEPGHDRLFKIRPFLSSIIDRFQRAYVPDKNLSLDECMIGFKGRLSFLQYMPKKPKKWGMKAWVLGESRTGYTWNWKLYTGKDESTNRAIGLAHSVVLQLIQHLAGKGYNLYCDNFYSSPNLFLQLHTMGIGACGTARIDRRRIPPEFQKAKLKKGEMMTYNDGPLMGLKWMDKRQVVMLSTIHDATVVEKRRRTRAIAGGVEVIRKPKVIEEYNMNMGGVDKGDQLVTYYGFSHRTTKWYKRVFLHLFEVSLVNAYILYCTLLPPKQRLSHLDFRISVASYLLRTFASPSTRHVHPTDDNPLRLTGRHFLGQYEKGCRDCKVCSTRKLGKRKQTKFYCKQCNLAMCPCPCFEHYHTLVNYKQ